MLLRGSSRFRVQESRVSATPHRVRSLPKTQLSLERRKLAEKDYYWENREPLHEDIYQIGPANMNGIRPVFRERNRGKRERSPHQYFHAKKFRLFDIPSPVYKENRLRKVRSDSKLERLSEPYHRDYIGKGYRLKYEIKRQLQTQAKNAYDYESSHTSRRKNLSTPSKLRLTMRERLKKELFEEQSQPNHEEGRAEDREYFGTGSSGLYSELTDRDENVMMQSMNQSRHSRILPNPNASYKKKKRNHNGEKNRTKYQSGEGIYEPQSNISGLALDSSNGMTPKRPIKAKLASWDQKSETGKLGIEKSSSVRAFLRSQVMHGLPKETDESQLSRRLPPQHIYDMNDSVNYSPYILNSNVVAQPGKNSADPSGIQFGPRQSGVAPNIQILESLEIGKRSSKSNSHLSEHRPPSDIVFHQKPVPVNQQAPMLQITTTTKKMTVRTPPLTNTLADPYGIGHVRIPSNKSILPEDMVNSANLKRIISGGGSSINTPDFSQPSSFVQQSSTMKQLPMPGPYPNQQERPPLVRQPIVSMNDIKQMPPVMGNSGIPYGIANPPHPAIIYQPQPLPQLNVLSKNMEYPGINVIQSEPAPQILINASSHIPTSPLGQPLQQSSQPVGVTQVMKLNQAMLKIFDQAQEQNHPAASSLPAEVHRIHQQPLSNTSLSLSLVDSDVPAIHSNDNFRRNQKGLTPTNSRKSEQPSQLLQQSNIQTNSNNTPSQINNTSAQGNDSQFSEPMQTLEKLVEYLEILDLFGTNIVQFDHIVSEAGKSDGLVNFYLYKRFLKEKKKLQDCIKGGPNLFEELDFLIVTDSELNDFRQDPQNEEVLEMIEEENQKVLSSLQGIMDFFKTRFKIFPKANLNLEEDFEYETMYYLNKEVEGLETTLKEPKLPGKKRRETHQRMVFLYEALFLIEFFNGRFIKEYEDYNLVTDLAAYLKQYKKSYSEEVTKYIAKRP